MNVYESLVNCPPDEFEEAARKVIDDYIDTLPQERKIKAQQQQWRIEQDLRKYKDPVARMNRMVELLYSGLDDLNSILGEVTDE